MAPILAIPLLVRGLLPLIPKNIRDEAFRILTTQSKRLATDFICDEFVVPRLGIPRGTCHKVAGGIVDELAKIARKALGG